MKRLVVVVAAVVLFVVAMNITALAADLSPWFGVVVCAALSLGVVWCASVVVRMA